MVVTRHDCVEHEPLVSDVDPEVEGNAEVGRMLRRDETNSTSSSSSSGSTSSTDSTSSASSDDGGGARSGATSPKGLSEAFTDDSAEEDADEFDVECFPSSLMGASSQDVGLPFNFIFAIDSSTSMGLLAKNQSNGGPPKRRIDLVLEACSRFVEAQTYSPTNQYSLITFAKKARLQVAAADQKVFLVALDGIELSPSGGTNYRAGLKAIGDVGIFSKLRVVLLSDGRPGDWNETTCTWFQTEWLSKYSSLEVHCVGVGDAGEFAVLQQISQIGGGTFHVSSLDETSLRCTFTSISASVRSGYSLGYPITSEKMRRTLIFVPPPSASKAYLASQDRVRFSCTRENYSWDPKQADIKLASACKVRVTRSAKPFAKGCMRYVFEMMEDHNKTRYVAKETVYTETTQWEELCYVKSSCLALHYAKQFRKRSTAKVHVLPCQLYRKECRSREAELEFFCGEEYTLGDFTKWISNNGYVSQRKHAEIASAFAHFTLHASCGLHIVTDIQGLVTNLDKPSESLLLTDPQVLSREQHFGRADLGIKGMQNFTCTHRCGPTCRKLGLSLGMTNLAESPKSTSRDGQLLASIWLQTYSRCPREFHDVFDHGPELQPARLALKEAGFSWELSGGAKIFVHPQVFRDISSAVAGRKLRPHHIIAEDSFIDVIQTVVNRLPSKSRVDVVHVERVALVGDQGEIVSTERTFLDEPHMLRHPQSVTQSTGQAHGRRNHRRIPLPETHIDIPRASTFRCSTEKEAEKPSSRIMNLPYDDNVKSEAIYFGALGYDSGDDSYDRKFGIDAGLALRLSKRHAFANEQTAMPNSANFNPSSSTFGSMSSSSALQPSGSSSSSSQLQETFQPLSKPKPKPAAPKRVQFEDEGANCATQ